VTNDKRSADHAISVPMELRVLVIGHDSDRLGVDVEAVRESLRSVLTTIRDEAATVPQCRLSLLTGTSEGTDAVARSISKECGLELSIIAYSSISKVPEDAVRVVTFGYQASPQESTYLARAKALRDTTALQFSDFVVVVWDGTRVDDETDGTVRILREALLARKCVIWIKPSAAPEIRITSLQKLAKLDSLNLPEEPAAETLAAPFVPFTAPLDPNLEDIIRLSTSVAALDKINMRFEQLRKSGRPGLVDRGARALMLTKWPKTKYDPRSSWPVLPGTAWGSVPVFDDPFAQVDVAANFSAGDYRSRTWLLYLLGALAVALGAVGNAFAGGSGWQRALHFVELASVLLVLGVPRLKGGKSLHRRWTDLRALAEHLRYQRFVYPLAGAIAPLRQPLWSLDIDGVPQIRDSTAWLLHRLNVAAGLPTLGDPVLDISAALQRSELRQELISVVENQQEYHATKTEGEGHLHNRIKLVSTVVFGLTLFAIALRIIPPGFLGVDLSVLLGVCVVTLPALGSALFAIGTQLELVRIARQSEAQCASLERHLEALDQVQQSANRDPWLTAIELRRLLIFAADLMVAEFAAWEALVITHQMSI
jgi:hypothetical protein